MNKHIRHIILLVLIGAIPILTQFASAQTATQNYIRTIEAGIASTSNPMDYISEDSRSSIQYLDGLGRPVQTVLVGQGGGLLRYRYQNRI